MCEVVQAYLFALVWLLLLVCLVWGFKWLTWILSTCWHCICALMKSRNLLVYPWFNKGFLLSSEWLRSFVRLPSNTVDFHYKEAGQPLFLFIFTHPLALSLNAPDFSTPRLLDYCAQLYPYFFLLSCFSIFWHLVDQNINKSINDETKCWFPFNTLYVPGQMSNSLCSRLTSTWN